MAFARRIGIAQDRPLTERTPFIFFLVRLWRRADGPGEAQRRALEDWVRLRFQLAASDPMIAIIGAVGRLTEAGMSVDDATDTALRILEEERSGAGS